MRRTPIKSPEQALQIYGSYALIKALAQCQQIEWHNFPDADFKSPIIHNHVKKVLESSKAIQIATGALIKTAKGNEDQGTDYAYELLRAIKFIIDNLPYEALKAFNDKSGELFPNVELTEAK